MIYKTDEEVIELARAFEERTLPRSEWTHAAYGPFTIDVVLGMAVSTIIILMLINGFAFCEAFGVEPKGAMHRFGAFIAGLSGSTASANFKLLTVYSCAQYTKVSAGRAASLDNEVCICSAVPSNRRPQPPLKRVSPQNTAPCPT